MGNGIVGRAGQGRVGRDIILFYLSACMLATSIDSYDTGRYLTHTSRLVLVAVAVVAVS